MGLFSGISKAVKSVVGGVSDVVGSVSGALGGASWLGPALGFAGGILGQQGAAKANQQMIASTKEQMDWQERMRSTQYQTAVQDLLKAGLNPMLAYQQGGAGTPSGAHVGKLENENAAGISAAQTSALNAASIAKIQAETATAETQAQLNQANAMKTAAETQLTTSNAGLASIQLDKTKFLRDVYGSFDVEGRQLDAKSAQAVYDHFSAIRDWNTLNYLDDLARKHKFRNFDEATGNLEFRRMLQTLALQANQIPESQAMAKFWKGQFGQDIAPYLNSAKSMSDIGNQSFGTGIKLFRKGH